MASPLANAHIEGGRRLRQAVSLAVGRVWDDLPGHDRENVDEWLSKVLPLVAAGQRQSAALTEALIARTLRRQPLGFNPDNLTGAAVRNGVDPTEVYQRPFVTLWAKLGEGVPFADASAVSLARAQGMAAWDVQASMRATANAVQQATPEIIGYERVADGDPCEFCAEVDTAFVKSADAMALHNNCGCGLEPVTAATRGQRTGQKGQHGRRTAVHEHGELGPVLGDTAHDFTSATEALA